MVVSPADSLSRFLHDFASTARPQLDLPLTPFPPPPESMISAEVSPVDAPPDGSSPEDQWKSINSARKLRPARACTARSSARLLASSPAPERRSAVAGVVTRREKEEQHQTSRFITPLTQPPPPPAQLPRWTIRSMWELASLLNFLNVFRPLLNIAAEFSAEELETALISPNSTLDDVHIPLLRAIPPVTRMALGRTTWVTVLCRKLKDWWHWVADGEIPLVASHGAEVEIYKNLDPATRVLILKALCDIRVEQEDIRNYIDGSLKHGIQLSAFRKERIGGDSHGVSYWYEDDPIVGHRLYREIRNIEVKKSKGKALPAPPSASYQWEMVASNLDEFQDVSDKLLDSKNRTEVSLAKKLKIDILPEVDKIQKRKDKLLKKQHRQALLLDSFVTADGISSGRSLRDRKPVTYTFDDYDKSINEAIKITKKRQNSPDPVVKKEPASKPESNGESNGTPQVPQHVSYDVQSPNQTEYDETDDEFHTGPLDRSNRRRKRPQRYSNKEFVEAISDNEVDFDSDDIVGEAVYDDEYLRSRKHKLSSSSEGDEEYRWEDNAEDEEEDEEEDSLSISEDSDEHPQYKKLRSRSRRGTKLRSVEELQSGLRRSGRSTKPRINYKQYELSDTDTESEKADKFNESDAGSDAMSDLQVSSESQDSQDEEGAEEVNDEKVNQGQVEETISEAPQSQPVAKTDSPGQVVAGAQKRRFLDLNELAPGTGFEDGPNTLMKNEDDNT